MCPASSAVGRRGWIFLHILHLQVTRGHEDPRRQGLAGMKYHMTYKHPDIKITEAPRAPAQNSRARHVPGSTVCIFNLRTHEQRNNMFRATLPGNV